MEFIKYLRQENIFAFMFLFGRLSGLVFFLPFFNDTKIPIIIKISFVLLLTFLFFPLTNFSIVANANLLDIALSFLSEILLGMCAGLLVQLTFTALQLAGEQISFVMGFTMASVIDPQTGTNTPIISNMLTLLALLMFLSFDVHHLLLMFYYKTLGIIELGSFYLEENVLEFIAIAVKNVYIIGFSLAFPVIALSLLSDVIFGMLMKTMPQFNLLVVGFPIKITLGFVVLCSVLGSILLIFKENILKAMNELSIIFF